MVTCFSVVLPMLTVLALLSNMLEYRLLAYRQLRVVQRPLPTGSDGIGAWQSIFAGICTLAVMVNAGITVFGMQPFRDLELSHKLLAFMCVEHTLLFTKMAVEVAIPDLPLDVDKAEDKNEDYIQKIFGGGYKMVRLEENELSCKESVWCNPDDTQAHDDEKYTPWHLTQEGKLASMRDTPKTAQTPAGR